MMEPISFRDTPLPLDYFERKYQLSRTTLWRYRKSGLKTLRVGAKCFIRESDFISFLQLMSGQVVTSDPLDTIDEAQQ